VQLNTARHCLVSWCWLFAGSLARRDAPGHPRRDREGMGERPALVEPVFQRLLDALQPAAHAASPPLFLLHVALLI
jgi:hypothetical protein